MATQEAELPDFTILVHSAKIVTFDAIKIVKTFVSNLVGYQIETEADLGHVGRRFVGGWVSGYYGIWNYLANQSTQRNK